MAYWRCVYTTNRWRTGAVSTQLTDGVLALCLLDMLRRCYNALDRNLSVIHVDLKHPLLNNTTASSLHYFNLDISGTLGTIINKYGLTSPYNHLDFYSLMNINVLKVSE